MTPTPAPKPHVDALRRLSDALGLSGREDDVAALILELLGDAIDESWRDPLGNLFVRRRGRTSRVLLLDAHMDEVGLMVQHIDEHGFLYFETIGGWDLRVLPAQSVLLHVGPGRAVPGVIGSVPQHIQKDADRSKAFERTALYIDVGCRDAAEVEALGIRIGTPAIPFTGFRHLTPNVVAGKALDDRIGCAAIVSVLRALRGEEPEMTLVGSFSIGEEVGLRGAEVIAANVEPDVVLCFEGTVDGTVPGVAAHNRPTEGGRGPAITIADRSFIATQRMIDFLEGAARAEGIPHQRRKPIFGGTNAGAIHKSGRGILCGVISCPCRYIHSANSLTRLDDYEATIRLGLAAVRRAPDLFLPE